MKTLFQVTEAETRTLPNGDSKIVRSTSNPDANGNLQVVQREVQETHKIGPDVQETETTVMLPSINGGLAPAMRTQERQERSGNTIEIQKTALFPDGTGSWQVGEVRQSTIKDEGKERSKEERVSRPDTEGRLNEITRTEIRESETASGDRRESKKIFSIDLPGATQDINLHLVQRVTTTQRSNSGSQQSTQLAEQPNPGDPGAGLHVTTIDTDIVGLAYTGGQATRTIEILDANGNLSVISVDMTKSDSTKAIEVQIAPSKPK